MTKFRRAFVAFLAAPLALGLGACSSSEGEGSLPKGEAIAVIPPPAGQTWSQVVKPVAEYGMLMGNPEAPIKLVEYGSLSCPHCARFAAEGMQPLIDKYVNSGRVSYEFHSYLIHGIIDLPFTALLNCAAPEAYFPMVEQIYRDQEAILTRVQSAGPQAEQAITLPPEQRFPAVAEAFGLTEWVAARGIARDQANECLSKSAEMEKLAAQTQKWSEQGINSTPSFFLNGVKTEVTGWPQLEPLLQNAGAR
jgi:protein-disulfide isomerase